MAMQSERVRLAGVAITAREREVWCLIVQGLTDQKVAQRLCVFIHTVHLNKREIRAIGKRGT